MGMIHNNPMNKFVYNELVKYVEDPMNNRSTKTTFNRIIKFFEYVNMTPWEHQCLMDACMTYGFEFYTLNDMRSVGMTSVDIAKDIVSRGSK